MAEEQIKRQVARKLWIKDVLGGTYVKEADMKPNYIVLKDRSTAARVNLLGVAVSSDTAGLPVITLDDGTGRIGIRAFEPNTQMAAVQIGDIVLIIGRPRQFGSEIYVLPEIVKKIPDTGWIEVRKTELSKSPIIAVQETPQQAQNAVTEEVIDETFSLSEKVLSAIRSLDTGAGAEIDGVIENVGTKDAEKTIQFLLQSGDIFEVSPGKLKVLE
jgi:RPA family protein